MGIGLGALDARLTRKNGRLPVTLILDLVDSRYQQMMFDSIEGDNRQMHQPEKAITLTVRQVMAEGKIIPGCRFWRRLGERLAKGLLRLDYLLPAKLFFVALAGNGG